MACAIGLSRILREDRATKDGTRDTVPAGGFEAAAGLPVCSENHGRNRRRTRNPTSKRKKACAFAQAFELGQWCPEEDSNLHAREGAST